MRWKPSCWPIRTQAASRQFGQPGMIRRWARCKRLKMPGRDDEGIVIVGIDATEQARDAIARGSNFEATVAQDFAGMAQKVADLVESHLGGAVSSQVNHYVPANLVTQADLSE